MLDLVGQALIEVAIARSLDGATMLLLQARAAAGHAVEIGVGICLFVLGGTAVAREARGLLIGTGVAHIVLSLWSAALRVVDVIGGGAPSWLEWLALHQWWVTAPIWILAAAALVESGRRIERTFDGRTLPLPHLIAFVLIGARGASLIADIALGEAATSETWLRVLRGIVLVGDLAILVVLARIARRAAHPSARGPAAAGAPDPAWESAAAGLDLYVGALGFRIAIGVGVGVMLMIANLSRSAELAKLLMAAAPVASLLCTIPMIFGVFRFSAAPAQDVQGLAVIAAVCMIFGSAVDVWVLVLAAAFFGTRVGPMFEAMDMLPIAEALAYVFGGGAILSLLGAFARTATALGDEETSSRAKVVAGFIIPALLLAVLTRALAAADLEMGGAIVVLTLALVFLGLALAGLISFLRLVTHLRQAMREFRDAPGA